jgi:hypothetical protein
MRVIKAEVYFHKNKELLPYAETFKHFTNLHQRNEQEENVGISSELLK